MHCYQLIPKGKEKTDANAAKLNAVDAAVRAHLGMKPDPERWAYDWHNVIGLYIATMEAPLGSAKLRKLILNLIAHKRTSPEYGQGIARVLMFLEQNYNSRQWRE